MIIIEKEKQRKQKNIRNKRKRRLEKEIAKYIKEN